MSVDAEEYSPRYLPCTRFTKIVLGESTTGVSCPEVLHSTSGGNLKVTLPLGKEQEGQRRRRGRRQREGRRRRVAEADETEVEPLGGSMESYTDGPGVLRGKRPFCGF